MTVSESAKSSSYLAVLAKSFKGPQDVEIASLERDEIQSNEVRIAIRAAGVNVADLMSVSGTHQDNPPPPFVPGFEAAGEIVGIGAGVEYISVGDRVITSADYGAFASELIADYRLCAPLPKNADFAEGASIPVAFGTAYTALVQRAQLQTSEWLLVMGGGGNIGGGAVQIGQILGARVIAPGGGSESCEKLRTLGADYVIDYRKEDVAEKVREITQGHGADVIFDAVTGKAFKNTHAALAKMGRHITAGAAGGAPPSVDLMPLITNTASLIGVDWQHFVRLEPEVAQEALRAISGWWKRGWIQPPPFETCPLSQARELLQGMENGSTSKKVVLTIGE